MMSFNRTNTTDCPCKDCEDRHSGCHGKCQRFAEWRVKVDERREKERRFYQSNNTISEHHRRQIWRKSRWRNVQTMRRSDKDR